MQILTHKSLQLDAILDEERVVVDHLLIVFILVRRLNVVADVVDATSANIAARTFQLVRSLLHVLPLLLVQARSDHVETICE